jgi:putative endonuclease
MTSSRIQPTTKKTGDAGEALARKYLEDHGLTIVELNYRFEYGEIDIVAKEGDVLVFCEVKTRYNDEFGDPLLAITPKKQRQIRRVANGYLFEHEIHRQECRFDVVAIRMNSGRAEIEHLKNAF